MKKSIGDGLSSAVIYNNMNAVDGGLLGVENISKLPRDKHQVYQVKARTTKVRENEDLALYFSTTEENLVLDHYAADPAAERDGDIWVLVTKEMCTNLDSFCGKYAGLPLSVDPTFDFGEYEVTPVTYRHPLLINRRSRVPPIFMGPTAIHHGKDRATYGRIASTLVRSCPELKHGAKCLRHFRSNCKEHLSKIGIRSKSDQDILLKMVFGTSGKGGLVDSYDKDELASNILALKEKMEEKEKGILGKDWEGQYESKFWQYIKRNETIMAEHIICSARTDARMPLQEDGTPLRCYTNQSESINNVLTKQKESVIKGAKKKEPMSKVGFVRDVWKPVLEKQKHEVIGALCSRSTELKLSGESEYLAVSQEVWVGWSSRSAKR
jgi:hypothetical protein